MRLKQFVWVGLAICACVRAAEGVPRDERAVEILNFSQLIDKAERIVLAEIGERKDGRVAITPLEVLKAPAAPETGRVTPEMIKLAEELLKKEGGKGPARKPVVKDEPITLVLTPEQKLPAGEQALFFLWEPEKVEEGAGPAYSVRHPQCMYDAELTPQVRAAILKPRSISDGRFLRSWDQNAAQRLARRKADEDLKKLPLGETVQGIAMSCVRPSLSLRGDGTFLITTRLFNHFGKELQVYDGPASSYGAILRAKDDPAEKAMILRLGGFEGVDASALNITSMLDFAGIAGGDYLPREHTFDAKKFPILKTLNGKYLVRTFYTNAHDGIVKGRPQDSLESPAWTGTIVSKEVELEFKGEK